MQPLSNVRIRQMRSDDLDFAAALTAAEGWVTETREEFEGFITHDPLGCFVAEWIGCRAAVCVATVHGDRAFIGEMLVHPDFRLRGVGPHLFGRVLESLYSRGCRSVSLDAVPRAVAFYKSVGFRIVCRSFRFTGKLTATRSEVVRPMTDEDFKTVRVIDAEAFGVDRSFFLRRRFALHPELAAVQVEDGRMTGFILGRRRGPFIWAGPWWVEAGTRDPAALLRTFGRGSGAENVLLGVLETNSEAAATVRCLGFRERGRASVRMILGDPGLAFGHSTELFAIGSAAKG